MFAVGSLVLYGIHGVCKITREEQRTVDRKQISYLVLEPLDSSGSQFLVPSHNENALSKLRPILTKQELMELLHGEAVHKDAWTDDENLRKQRYRELISGSDRAALLQMVCSLHNHKKMILDNGRKFHLCDENFLKDAERILNAEFSVVLELPHNQVIQFVLDEMSK